MSQVAKFTRGTRTLDVTTGRYRLARNFVPPAVNLTPSFAEGTSANQMGAALVDTKAENREWEFGVHVQGTSEAEVTRGIRDLNTFLAAAGDESDPLFFETRATVDVLHEPLWGQYGANLHHEVVFGQAVRLPAEYGHTGVRKAWLPNCMVKLTLGPRALGRKQRAASALGQVWEDTLGLTDGSSRGTVIVEGVLTNLFPNPFFGNFTTWNTSWTAGGNLVVLQNTDPAFVVFHLNSAKITSRGATLNTFTSSLTLAASTHTIYGIVALADGSAPTSSDLQISYNGVDQATTFTRVGDTIFYYALATVTGTGGAAATGFTIKNGRTIYVGYADAKAKAYWTPPVHGWLLGCAFSGAVNNSSSTNAAGRIRTAVAQDTFNLGQGTIRISVRFDFANTFATDVYLFSCGSTSLRAFFRASDDKIVFTDNTNTAASSALTFSAGTIYHFEFVYLPGAGLAIYINGAANGTAATYTPPALPSFIYWGSTDTATNQGPMTLLLWDTMGEANTAAEVLADYTNLVEVANDGQRIMPAPYLWTKGGDDVAGNCDDSSRDNYCVVGGIPGDAPAETQIQGTLSGLGWGTIQSIVLSLLDLPETIFSAPLFFDLSGVVDANACGGERRDVSVSTSVVELSQGTVLLPLFYLLLDREFYAFARLWDEGSNLKIQPQFTLGAQIIAPDMRAVTTAAAYRLLQSNPFIVPTLDGLFFGDGINISATVKFYGQRTSGTANVRLDYWTCLPRPLVVIGNTDSSGSNVSFLYSEKTGARQLSSNFVGDYLPASGDAINLLPGRLNLLRSVLGEAVGVDPAITYTLTYTRVNVTPRWNLI